jgi:tetratricopeptide (TPR) repeat protein
MALAKHRRLRVDSAPKRLEGREALKALCSPDVRKPLTRALDALDQGNLIVALQQFAAASALDPTNKAVLYFGADAAQRAYFHLKHQEQSPPPAKLAQWRDCTFTLAAACAEADPADPVAAHNVGRFIQDDGDDAGSIPWYQHALGLKRELVESWGNMGTALYTIGRVEEAEIAWSKCVMFEPENPTGMLAQAYVWLRRGDYARGWPALNARWNDLTFVQNYGRKDLQGHAWNGQPLRSRDRILVHGEQGLGDHVMFARFVPALMAAYPGKVAGVETRAPLKRWMEASLPGVPIYVRDAEELPHITHHVPMMSLPGILGMTELPPPVAPRHEICPPVQSAHRRVGIVWSGAKGNLADAQRSIPISLLTALADIPGVIWVPLAYDPDGSLTLNASLWLGSNVEACVPYRDVLGLADAMQSLDHIVTVDSLQAHVAGSVGIPTTILHRFNLEWRWSQAPSFAPWYENMTHLVCPAPNDWTTALRAVRERLEAR